MQSPKLDHDPISAASADAVASLLSSRGLDQVGLGEMKGLLALIRDQYAPLLAGRKQIALVGPVNSGKSSLYNALIAPSAPKADVSSVPGTTRTALAGDATAFWVIDTPGANEAQVGSEDSHGSVERHQAAMVAATLRPWHDSMTSAYPGPARPGRRIPGSPWVEDSVSDG
jgi:hypothetical protein